MGENLAELVETGEKRDKRGRRIVDAKQRSELVAAYAKSGLTQRVFAEREGVPYHTFVDWLQRERQRGNTVPVAPKFRELSLGAMLPARSAVLEVKLPGGMIVRGEDAAAVAELVRALQRPAR